jgi:dihydrofolate reductase
MKTILLAVATIDGKIARHPLHAVDRNSSEDKVHFIETIKRVGVVIEWANTFKSIDQKVIPKRRTIVMTHDPKQFTSQPWVEFFSWSAKDLIWQLHDQWEQEVIIAGGAQINYQFLQADLIDEIRLTIEPLIFGRGVGLVEGDTDLYNRFHLLSIDILNQDTLIVKYKR